MYCRCLSTACSGMVMRSLCTAGVYLPPVLEEQGSATENQNGGHQESVSFTL